MSSARRLLVPVFVSAAVILSAPFVGQIRAALRAAFPARFVTIVGVAVGLSIAIALVVALIRIRERRPAVWRYAVLGSALALGLSYSAATSTGVPEVDAVERVHFVEYGLVAFLFYRAWRPRGDASIVILPVLAGVIVGTLEEWFQWFIPVRVGEARDIALNLVAIGCGLLFSIGVDPPDTFTRQLRRGSATSLGVGGAVVVLVFATFVHAIHLGYDITEDDIGSFKSRYRADALEALAADRSVRWRTDPPLVLRRLSREDQYMDEGLWHVRRRNDAWTAEDHATAWRENRILEKFFAPVLETPSYAAATGHRWQPGQRADAERRGAGSGSAGYVSDAEPRPILTWSKPAFWVAAVIVALLLALPCVLFDRRWSSRHAEQARV
jgi:VanZ family protein